MKTEEIFNQFNKNKLELLDQFYAQNITFIDPAGRVHGIENLKNHFAKVYSNVQSIRFDFTEELTQDSKQSVFWTMHLVAPPLNSGKELSLEGMSLLKFNENNMCFFHRDYFDMGAFIYEKIPLLGYGIRLIKKRLAFENQSSSGL